jgi:DNA-binding transcriptional regulator YiaG
MTPLELKAARKTLGLTQGELARALGMSGDRIVRRWESGERPVPGPVARMVRVFIEDRKVLRRYLDG